MGGVFVAVKEETTVALQDIVGVPTPLVHAVEDCEVGVRVLDFDNGTKTPFGCFDGVECADDFFGAPVTADVVEILPSGFHAEFESRLGYPCRLVRGVALVEGVMIISSET